VERPRNIEIERGIADTICQTCLVTVGGDDRDVR
jgi:hypothetical protein